MQPSPAIHNPDRYMTAFRQILSQGRKRIGILIGAGAPTSILVDKNNQLAEEGRPLIPNVAGLTTAVMEAITDDDRKVVGYLKEQIKQARKTINIETILTQVRLLSQAIGNSEVYGLNGDEYGELARRICSKIGEIVGARLPVSPNPYTELVSWISGTQREHSVEIFTPNYDLLIEEAFERSRVPYFDGFSGSYRPFFDAASVSSDVLPARWARLWKLHGSLGWKISDNAVVRTGRRNATELIYPDHLKYDQVRRLPYSALFERLRTFLLISDTLLICTGFSFLDSHICAVLDEALAENAHTAIYAFQYGELSRESAAAQIARSRPNISIYAPDGAIVNGVKGLWRLGHPPSADWEDIRQTFWNTTPSDGQYPFLLGDFAMLARFLALIQAPQIASSASDQRSDDSDQLSIREHHDAQS